MTTQTKTTYTPGPWELRHERHLGKTDHIIKIGTSAVYFQRGVGQTEAETIINARLIASAPELLEALKRVRHAFYVDGTSKALRVAFEGTKELVAKAEGRGE